ncbi:MAG: dihydrofolate reductase family protein [bacterium]|nr:dihydrofolate reductase family protein [bacterium]
MDITLHCTLSLDGRPSGWPQDKTAHADCLAALGAKFHLMGADSLADYHFEPLDLGPVEIPEGSTERPLLVVVDGRGRVLDYLRLAQSGKWSGFVVLTAPRASPAYLSMIEAQGVTRIVTGGQRVDLPEALDYLEQQFGPGSLVVESAGRLAAALLSERMVEHLSLLYNSVLVGGLSPHGVFGPGRWFDPVGPLVWELTSAQALTGGTLWTRYQRFVR